MRVATSALKTLVVSRGQKMRNADTLLPLLHVINRPSRRIENFTTVSQQNKKKIPYRVVEN